MTDLPELIISLGALITAMASSAAVIMAAINNMKLTKVTNLATDNTVKLDHAVTKVEKIEVATNSMKDALVETTRIAAELKGRADLLAEQKEAGSNVP